MPGLKVALSAALLAVVGLSKSIDSKEYIVQLGGKSSHALSEEISGHGVHITGVLGQGRYAVFGSEEAVDSLKSHPRVVSVSARNAAHKISPALKEHHGRLLSDGVETVDLFVVLVNAPRTKQEAGEIASQLKSEARDKGIDIEVRHISSRKVGVTLATRHLMRASTSFAGSNHVSRVEHRPEFRVLNMDARWETQGQDDPSSLVTTRLALSGANEIVGVADTGLDYDSCFFRDDSEQVTIGTGSEANMNHRKVIQYNPYTDHKDDDGGHGTHVCGSIAGASLGDNADYDGMAPDAKIAFFDVGENDQPYLNIPMDLSEGVFPDPYELGARLHSNSWGTSSADYDSNSQEIDQFTWDHPDFLVLVAAGNDGDDGLGSVGSPSTNKNGVCVGASGNTGGGWQGNDRQYYNEVVYFSSRGPTTDGRLKPDVLAPGDQITSARSDGVLHSNQCDTLGMSGTSMATPITAGLSALVRQYFKEGMYPSGVRDASAEHEPSAALVKAMLVGSAVALYGDDPAPSMYQGFGRVRLDTVLVESDSDFNLFVNDDLTMTLDTDDSQQFCFNVASPDEFKATLVWSDYPGDLGSADILVNDLTLVVTEEDGTVTFGNHRIGAAEFTVDGESTPFAHAYFGGTLDITPPLSAEVVVLSESGCSAITTDLTGKIAMVSNTQERTCHPSQSALAAQNAGAIAVVMPLGRSQPLAGGMTDSVDGEVTIPVVAVAADGQGITSGVVASLGVTSQAAVDTMNNIEQVRISPSGLVSVMVYAQEVAMGPQAFALVVTGDFEVSSVCPDVSACPLCANGECTDGECVCHEGWYGGSCSQEVCPNDCSGNGVCNGEVCECNPGYSGEDCGSSACSGNVVLTARQGVITHDGAGGDYVNNAMCTWSVQPKGSYSNIVFTVEMLDLEDEFDNVYVLDGDSAEGALLKTLTGGRAGAKFSTNQPSAYLAFLSDESVVKGGFVISYRAYECWSGCEGSGECTDGMCECEEGKFGLGCEKAGCCSQGDCGEHGACSSSTCTCECMESFFGESCHDNFCHGMETYETRTGTLTHGAATNYADSSYCAFWISTPGAVSVTLTFDEFETEAGYDYLRVYSDLQESELLGEYDGSKAGLVVSFPYPSVKVAFSSDGSETEAGFSITYVSTVVQSDDDDDDAAGGDDDDDDTMGGGDDDDDDGMAPVFGKEFYEFEVTRRTRVGARLGRDSRVTATDPQGDDVTISASQYLTFGPKGATIWDGPRMRAGTAGNFTITACDSGNHCSTVDANVVSVRRNRGGVRGED